MTEELLNNPRFAIQMTGRAVLSAEEKEQIREQWKDEILKPLILKRIQNVFLAPLIQDKPGTDFDQLDETWEHQLRRQEIERTKGKIHF